ncbi:MAG: hypothetical protein OXD46_04655 [Chloroflexi bacterium]|nr:hypothetical protein [Chloroflexota bacterium]
MPADYTKYDYYILTEYDHVKLAERMSELGLDEFRCVHYSVVATEQKPTAPPGMVRVGQLSHTAVMERQRITQVVSQEDLDYMPR